MGRKSLKRYTLRYTLGAGIPGGIAVLVLAWLGSIPPLLVSLLVAFLAIAFAALIVGAADAGVETAAAGAEAGFMAGTDVMQYQPVDIPLPDRLALVCWLCGLAVVGIAVLT